MTLNLRRMKKYHPRRSSREIKLNKQKLTNLEHQIKANVGEFLIFLNLTTKHSRSIFYV